MTDDTYCTDDCPTAFHIHGHVTIPDNAIPTRDDAGNVIGWVVPYPPLDEQHMPPSEVAWGDDVTTLGYTTEGAALIKPEHAAPNVGGCIYCLRDHHTGHFGAPE